ncbi:MAG: hypothetical protein WB297_10585 [Actinomycetota bacterium]
MPERCEPVRWRSLAGSAPPSGNPPAVCGCHTSRYVLIRYQGGESEVYDLRRDPWQLRHVDGDPSLARTRASLSDRLVQACVPPPPRLTLRR